ncbi:MAG: hypothetical protein FJ280_23575 [Planctomycetes bacterium]|nr:hypothetical protein [Planctomycetota bacterium]
MGSGGLLLKAYYEQLHEWMQTDRARLLARLGELLSEEVARQGFPDMDASRLDAYREACVAFLDERLESYNPLGIQYTFDRVSSAGAAELEFQLNWYNSRPEFAALVAAARSLAGAGVPDEELPDLAEALIRQVGAYPDRSIIEAYTAEPALPKLPDYIVACAIEEIVCGRDSREQ